MTIQLLLNSETNESNEQIDKDDTRLPIFRKTHLLTNRLNYGLKKTSVVFNSLAKLFWEIADKVGANTTVAYAQSPKEIGYGNFRGVPDATYYNPCEMKITASGGNYDPNAHKRFETWEDDIAAQIGHLALYA